MCSGDNCSPRRHRPFNLCSTCTYYYLLWTNIHAGYQRETKTTLEDPLTVTDPLLPPIQLSKDILLLFPFLEPKPNNSSNSSSSTVSSRILSSSFSFSPYPTGLHHSPSPRKRFGSLVGLLTCDLLSYRRVPFSSPSSYSVYSFLSFFFFFLKLIFN